jgi:ferredoxin
MTIAVRFLPDDIIIEAETGELLLDVAKKAGIDIPTGCLMGCITGIPGDQDSLTVHLYSDPLW